MKVLFATTNKAKINSYKEQLARNGIELFGINDLDFKLDIDENGKDVLENAKIKAKAYYEKTKMPTIGMDDGLYIEGIPEEKQPGTHVRRVDGKQLDDKQMIEYYSKLVKENGGKLTAKWVYGMVIYNKEKIAQFSWSKSNFYLVDKPSDIINEGYPLDSISIIPKFNKYLSCLNEEERKIQKNNSNQKDIINFITKTILEK